MSTADDQPPTIPGHERPAGVDDATVTALGKQSEALETIEHARGLLYGFLRLSGTADLALGDAIDERRAREQLVGGRRHLYEAAMKRREITPGRPGHEPSPCGADY